MWVLQFFSKERIIKIIAALAFAGAGAAAGMKASEVQTAACGVEIQK